MRYEANLDGTLFDGKVFFDMSSAPGEDDDGNTLYLCARSGLYRMRLNIAGVRPMEIARK